MSAVKNPDVRPPVAVGHVYLHVQDVPTATEFFEQVGLRLISLNNGFSVMELRGGTHLQLMETKDTIAPGTPSPVDIMVDNVDEMHAAYAEKGLNPSEIKRGRIHDTFILPGPEGYELEVTSPHWMNRAI